jgi:hypothetical protein
MFIIPIGLIMPKIKSEKLCQLQSSNPCHQEMKFNLQTTHYPMNILAFHHGFLKLRARESLDISLRRGMYSEILGNLPYHWCLTWCGQAANISLPPDWTLCLRTLFRMGLRLTSTLFMDSHTLSSFGLPTFDRWALLFSTRC